MTTRPKTPLPPTLPLRMDALEARMVAVLRTCALPREVMFKCVKPDEGDG